MFQEDVNKSRILNRLIQEVPPKWSKIQKALTPYFKCQTSDCQWQQQTNPANSTPQNFRIPASFSRPDSPRYSASSTIHRQSSGSTNASSLFWRLRHSFAVALFAVLFATTHNVRPTLSPDDSWASFRLNRYCGSLWLEWRWKFEHEFKQGRLCHIMG